MSDDKFDLTWNDFGRNAEKTIRNLANDSLFTDVTLLSDDCKRIKAHKVILSSSSNFFRQVLSETSADQPLLFLKGIQHSELQALIKFIYIGTTEIAQEDLNNFMKAAADLQIEGLLERKNVDDIHDNIAVYQDTITNHTLSAQYLESNNDVQYLDPNNDEPNNKIQYFDVALDQETDFSSTIPEVKIENFEKNEDGSYSCDRCEYKNKRPSHLKIHMLGKHLGAKFKCNLCEREFSSKSNLQIHMQSKHEGKKYRCEECNVEFIHPAMLSQHRAKYHKYL